MKHLLLTLLFVVPSAFGWDQQAPLPVQSCAQFVPYGAPVIQKKDTTSICRHGYYTVYDNIAKIPVYVVYTLKPENALGCWPRTNSFATDVSLPKDKRSTPDDYADTGYDKGHNVPDGDLSYDQYIQLESFLMTNMSPQLPNLNRGIWKVLETDVRVWAWQRNHTLQITTGPIYAYGDPSIGVNKVVVPKAFFKVVIDTQTGETFAFLFPHKNGLGSNISSVQTTVAEIEKYAGMVIPVPSNANKNSKLPLWPVNFDAALKEKHSKCK